MPPFMFEQRQITMKETYPRLHFFSSNNKSLRAIAFRMMMRVRRKQESTVIIAVIIVLALSWRSRRFRCYVTSSRQKRAAWNSWANRRCGIFRSRFKGPCETISRRHFLPVSTSWTEWSYRISMYIASRRRDTWWHRSLETTKVVRTVVLLLHAPLRSVRSERERKSLKCADIAGLNRYFVWARDTVYSKLCANMRSNLSVPTTKSLVLRFESALLLSLSLSLSLSRTHFNSSRTFRNVQCRESATLLATRF